MNLHEYQAKELLASYGLPVQGGILAHNGEETAAAYDKLGGKFAVVKAQVHAGGRGKAERPLSLTTIMMRRFFDVEMLLSA